MTDIYCAFEHMQVRLQRAGVVLVSEMVREKDRERERERESKKKEILSLKLIGCKQTTKASL